MGANYSKIRNADSNVKKSGVKKKKKKSRAAANGTAPVIHITRTAYALQ